MINIPTKIKSFGVFGLGDSGLSVVKALLAQGLYVIAGDDNQEACVLAKDLGADIFVSSLPNVDILIISPSIALTHPEPHPVVLSAQERNIPIWGDINLFQMAYEEFSVVAPIIAVTGTNGKSTVVKLISHILHEAGFDVQMGGNIGRPVLDLDMPQRNTIYVLELSSYQIDLLSHFPASVAILLNITPDHIDRHGTLENYAAVKWKLFENLSSDSLTVIGVDGVIENEYANSLTTPLTRISAHGNGDIIVQDSIIYVENKELIDLSNLDCFPGEHSGLNAAAAFAAVQNIGVSAEDYCNALKSFMGLEHRLQLIANYQNIKFINDSKATNAAATEKALNSFENIYWIVGGVRKFDGISSLMPYSSRIRHAYLIGESAQIFSSVLGSVVSHSISETLESAVSSAFSDALSAGEGVVLFSPACASFDQFPNFEIRGQSFCHLVHACIDGVSHEAL